MKVSVSAGLSLTPNILTAIIMIADSTTSQDEVSFRVMLETTEYLDILQDCVSISSEEETNPPSPYRHLNLNHFLPNNPTGISDEDLVNRPIKEINKTFKTTGKEGIPFQTGGMYFR